MHKIISFFKAYAILGGCLIFVLVIKIPHLHLPYSWDEAWSYLPAVLRMTENGPSLLPSSIGLFDSKGHPLLFYFFVSSWISLFSSQIWIVRIFLLLISLILCVTLYYIILKLTNKSIAGLTIILFSVQSLFLAQASLLLPEVLLTLFFLLSMYFFISKQWILFSLFSTMMLLTKETGLVFIMGFGLYHLFENRNKFRTRSFWHPVLWMSFPVIVYGIHLTMTYLAFNTFFFNEHLDYISFDANRFLRVLKSATGILFTMYGRNLISLMAIISLLIILFRKEKIKYNGFLILILLQIVLLLLFSSVNFYTYRYILPVFPFFIALISILFYQAFQKYRWSYYVVFVAMILSPMYYTITKKGRTDIDFGYASYLPLHKEMVEYCEQENLFGHTFAAELNMLLALRDPFTGYHKTSSGFDVKYLPDHEDVDFVIIDSTGEIRKLNEKQTANFKLIKRIENKHHWVELYSRNNAHQN